MYINLLNRFTEAAREAFGGGLTGVYLHGSAAMGCFHPERSDLDLILVVENCPSDGEKRAFMARAVELNREAPPKGLEFSVVRRAVCRPFAYPTPYELHFSPAHLDTYWADPVRYIDQMRGVDRDLAAHFTVINACGVVLYGREVSDVFGPVPRADYLDSIRRDVENACQGITRAPVYFTLNLCRALAQVEEGLVLSKRDGGRWGLEHLPEEYRPVVRAALDGYEAGAAVELPGERLLDFARNMVSNMYKYCEEESL